MRLVWGYTGSNYIRWKPLEASPVWITNLEYRRIPEYIDINGYKQKRAELLRDMAHRARREASTGSGVVELEPMSAFDRRIIHTTLDAYNNIKTESTGEGRDRRVIIKRV